ncbi:glycoside hydrolase family 3 protein [Suillus luteus UH-Slu-Lm8-n1]|uniref:xylan 1,4-beta-xylosidase n=1 Tax=Suillus luteus UH-Slu-Lm8-n1 TaxID=930992 RepID=A0A0C9ZU85_9AGAM|nr:glycoside hydrolase family 3 protein [Suillus luteus UH-Slu-Lm8-n1]
MGAAFDNELIKSVGSIVGMEGHTFNNYGRAGLDFWTPNINPFKDPRWGRGQETPGEDPYHLAQYVYNLVVGLQGELDSEPYYQVVSTCKHFAGYNLEDWDGTVRSPPPLHPASHSLPTPLLTHSQADNSKHTGRTGQKISGCDWLQQPQRMKCPQQILKLEPFGLPHFECHPDADLNSRMIALDIVQFLVCMWARMSASQDGMIILALSRLSWMFH